MATVMLDATEIERNKETILSYFGSIDVPPEFYDWICRSDFFIAPASSKYHLAYTGGLAQHSLNVYRLLKQKAQFFNIAVTESNLLIMGLCHDLAKVDIYKPTKEGGYEVEDAFPLGHAEKSISILQRFFVNPQLSDEVLLAIRFHMGQYENGNYSWERSFNQAKKLTPLVTLLHTADLEATFVVEAK